MGAMPAPDTLTRKGEERMGRKFVVVQKCREKGCGKVLQEEEIPLRLCLEHFPPHGTPSCVTGFCSAGKEIEEE